MNDLKYLIEALDRATAAYRASQAEVKATESAPASLPELPVYLTVAEVSHRLGVSRPTVYRLINNGVLPIVKIGACTRISSAALEKAIEKDLTRKYRRA